MRTDPGKCSASRRATRAWTAKSATVTGERSSFVIAPADHFPLNAAGQERRLADRVDGELGFRRVEHGTGPCVDGFASSA